MNECKNDMTRCGILLAGGRGTRLLPSTTIISKQLLPVFDKPLIYYSLSTLMKAGIKDILIIAANRLNMALFMNLFGIGARYGISITYKIQEKPAGISDAFLIGEEFINGRPVALALGDNIFYGSALDQAFESINDHTNMVFGCQVDDPTAYGVAVINSSGDLEMIVEKPQTPPSNWVVPGLYFYDRHVVEKAKTLKPSSRGELEITDLTNLYAKKPSDLEFIKLPGVHWFDAGTHEGMLEAAQFVHAVQSRTGEKLGDLDGIARSNGWTDLPF